MARGRTKQANPKNDNGANLGFTAQTFLAADKLCKNPEPSDDKHVALGHIFLQYISQAFEAKQAARLATDPAAAEDRDTYRAEHIVWVPKDARWSSMATQERGLSTDQGRSASSGRVIDPSFPISWGGTSYAE